MKPYLVIHRCEDEPHVKWMTEQEVKDFLVENPSYESLSQDTEWSFDSFPSQSYLIVRGAVVYPKPVQTVTEWKLP